MAIWAIADLHLAISRPEKDMKVFGPVWDGYIEKMEKNWRKLVSEDDLVLIAGDITWAMRLEDAAKDLQWIHSLPGTKVMIRGNHDYWWTSLAKVRSITPSSCHVLQHTELSWNGCSISGTRLWDTEEFNFNGYINYRENPRAKEKPPRDPVKTQEIFERELNRLSLACQALNQEAKTRIIMTHYPPVSADMQDSRASALLEEYNVDYCIFGHLHNVKAPDTMFGEKNGVRYLFTSADAIDFTPVRVM